MSTSEEEKKRRRDHMRKYREKNLGYKFRERERRKEYYSKHQIEEQRKAREYMRGYYENNKEQFAEYARVRYGLTRKRWDNFVAEQKCAHCRMADPECLEFHHRNPKEKDFHVSGMLSRRWDAVMAEVSKCIVLCANCHRKEHARLRREQA